MKDNITKQRISEIHPKLRSELERIYEKICLNLTGDASVRFTQVLRTFAYQEALYAKGRTKPGKIVTNALPGQSYHNYGLAVDFCLLVNNEREISWSMTKDFDGDCKADWMEVVTIFKSYGWEWGGDWHSIRDYPHFQKTFGYNWRELKRRYLAKEVDKNGYVIL